MGILLWVYCVLMLSSSPHMPLHTESLSVLQTFVIGPPQQKAAWSFAPTIRVCEDSTVTSSRISQAMRYWENTGYKFDGFYMDSISSCMNPRYGEIVITLPESGFADTHMGSTRIYTHIHTGDIVKAKIQILPKYARKDRVLEHELGHALGWSHYPQKFHMMHPTWKFGGYDRSGLRK